jgi:hypothetical protein
MFPAKTHNVSVMILDKISSFTLLKIEMIHEWFSLFRFKKIFP